MIRSFLIKRPLTREYRTAELLRRKRRRTRCLRAGEKANRPRHVTQKVTDRMAARMAERRRDNGADKRWIQRGIIRASCTYCPRRPLARWE